MAGHNRTKKGREGNTQEQLRAMESELLNMSCTCLYLSVCASWQDITGGNKERKQTPGVTGFQQVMGTDLTGN